MLVAGLLTAISAKVTATPSAFWQISSLFTIVSPLPVLWLGLSNGFSAAISASFVAAGAVLTATLFGAPYDLVALITQIGLILVLVKFSLLSRKTEAGVEWYPAGHILAYLVCICLAAVTVQIALGSGVEIPDEALKELAKKLARSGTEEDLIYLTMKKVSFLIPGIIGLTTLITFVINAKLAQNFLERTKQNIRPAGSYLYITLPNFYLWIAAAVTGLTLSGVLGLLGSNLLVVLMVGFFLVGLNFTHELVRRYNLGTITLVIFYLVMIVFGWLVLVVSLVGLLEPWLRPHSKTNGNL